jgi:hypothetical protein
MATSDQRRGRNVEIFDLDELDVVLAGFHLAQDQEMTHKSIYAILDMLITRPFSNCKLLLSAEYLWR